MEIITRVLVLAGFLATVAVNAQELWVEKIEITSPPNVTYSVKTPVDLTFTVWIGNKATDPQDVGQLTGLKVYFTNNAQFESATEKASFTATMPESPRSVGVSDGDATLDYSGNQVSINMLDDDCTKGYTHICVVIQHPGSDTESNVAAADDDACLALGEGEPGGVLSCPQPPVVSDDDEDATTPAYANRLSLSAVLCMASMLLSLYTHL